MARSLQSDQVAGIILAGGRSTRMGCDKALIQWQGRSLLDRARSVLCEAGCGAVWVSGRGDLADGLVDTDPGAGPGRALLDALALAQTAGAAGILAIPVDMPCLDAALLQPLMQSPRTIARAWAATPLPVYLPSALAQLDPAGIDSVRSLIAAGPHERPDAPTGSGFKLSNINTPDELARLVLDVGRS